MCLQCNYSLLFMWHDHLLTILIPSNTNMPLYAVKDLDFSDTCELVWKSSKAISECSSRSSVCLNHHS